MCRAHVVLEVLWEMAPLQRAEIILAARQQLPAPSNYVYHWAGEEWTRRMERRYAPMTAAERRMFLWKETRLTLDLLETFGLHEDLRVSSAEELLSKAMNFGFDGWDKRQLWFTQRILGCSHFLLHRVPAIPEIGSWKLVPPWIEIIGHLSELQQFFTAEVVELHRRQGSSEVIQVPVHTRYLHYTMGVRRRGPHPCQHERSGILGIAQREGVTYWCVLDFRKVDHGPELVLVPWPREQILTGFSQKRFPSWGPRDRSVTGGWSDLVDSQYLETFIATERETFIEGIAPDVAV